MFMSRRLWIIGVLLVLAATASGGWFYAQSRGSTPRFRTARIERGPVTATVSTTGTLNAVVTVQVGSQVSGQVKELFADFNSQVKRNQLVARIDPEKFQAAVAQAKAQVDMAKASVLNQRALVEKTRADLANAQAALAVAKAQTAKAQVAVLDSRRTLARNHDLRTKGFIAQADEDTAQAAYDSAVAQADSAKAQEDAQASQIRSAQAQLRVVEAQLESAIANVAQQEAGLKQAQVDLDHTQIRAPVDGVVVSRTVDVGQTVAASLAAPTLFTIAQDLTDMQVDTNVDEADVGRIRVGLRASFTVDAFRGQTFSGEVMQVRKAPQTVQNVVTYDVVISARNPDGKLLPGMTANVRLIVDQKDGVLKVPNAALRYRTPGEAAEAQPAAGAGPSGGPGGPPSVEQIRDRLVKSLGLSAEQEKKLEPILREAREKSRALIARNPTEGERRIEGQKIREASREQIRSILTPEQRGRYDQQLAEQAGGRAGSAGSVVSSGRVFVPGPDGKPRAVTVQLGISDGTFTEIAGGELRDGQDVITGSSERAGAPRPASGPRL
jgi:HlyD family secretion protein